MKRPSHFVAALTVILLLSCITQATVLEYADVSCRVEGLAYADTNRHDSSKLSVRASSNGVKSYIKFDIGDLDISSLTEAYLRVTLHAPKAGGQRVDVSAVNDDFLANINWGERDITWNNAPGNDVTSLGLLDPTATTFVGTISFTDGLAGDQFMIDVLSIMQADTDGIIQIVLHNSPNLLDFATWDHPSGEEFYPALVLVPEPMTCALLGLGSLLAIRRKR